MAGSPVSELRMPMGRHTGVSGWPAAAAAAARYAPSRRQHAWLLASLPIAGLLISGCASISEKDCLRGDWQTLGFEDGRAGRPSDRLAGYAKDCGDYDIQPDPNVYRSGYEAGIRQFCTVDNGLDKGESNADYEGICPADLEPAFLDGYLRGLDLARKNLKLAHERLALDLDLLRDDREIGDDIGADDDLDDEIDVLQSRLSANSFEREAINRKIARWNGQL